MTQEEKEYIIYRWATGADKEHICNCGNFLHFNHKEKKPIPPTPEPIYDSNTTISYFCEGVDKMKKIYTEYLSGYSMDNMVVYDTIENIELYEQNCVECGYEPEPQIIYKETVTTDEFCDGYTLFQKETTHYLSGYSEDSLEEYKQQIKTTILETDSPSCGYHPEPTPTYGDNIFMYRTNTSNNTFPFDEIQKSPYPTFVEHYYRSFVPTTSGDVTYYISTDNTHKWTTENKYNLNTGDGIVIFSEPLTEIKPFTFSNDETVTEIYIPKTVKIIGREAFDTLPNLNHFEYGGTVEQFKNITFGKWAFDNTPKHIYCSDGELDIKIDIFGDITFE